MSTANGNNDSSFPRTDICSLGVSNKVSIISSYTIDNHHLVIIASTPEARYYLPGVNFHPDWFHINKFWSRKAQTSGQCYFDHPFVFVKHVC